MTGGALGLGVFGGLGAGAAMGALVHDHLSDERIAFDPFYEAWLRSQDLRVLDRRASESAARSDIVVCLTSIPSRLSRIDLTLKSLLAQTMAPAAIRLHLPLRSRRESEPYVLPSWLDGLRVVSVVRCDDEGPATKLLPALTLKPDQRLLVVDDDRVYKRHFVSEFDRWSRILPESALGTRGWDVPGDLTDRPTTTLNNLLQRPPVPVLATRIRAPRPAHVLQGLGGVLVRPRFFDRAAVSSFQGAPEAARFVDDVWFAAHCLVPKTIVPIRRSNFPSYWDERRHKRSSLGLLNRGGGDVERRNNTILIRHFKDRWDARKESVNRRQEG